ncbi:MAG: helix-turn-helix domain-containing protein [Planctomycetota bacterium]
MLERDETPAAAPVQAAPPLSEVAPPALVVSLAKAAKMLGTCKRTLERERDRGQLRCLRIGRHWKVRVGALHDYIRRKELEFSK